MSKGKINKPPKLGTTVYLLARDYGCYYMVRDKVAYIGKHSFLVEDYKNKVDVEGYYEEYGEYWFTNFNEAKKALIEKFNSREWSNKGKWSIKKRGNDFWEVD